MPLTEFFVYSQEISRLLRLFQTASEKILLSEDLYKQWVRKPVKVQEMLYRGISNEYTFYRLLSDFYLIFPPAPCWWSLTRRKQNTIYFIKTMPIDSILFTCKWHQGPNYHRYYKVQSTCYTLHSNVLQTSIIWNFAGKTSVWSWRNWTGRDSFGGCCHQTPHMCVAMETETGNDDRDQCFKGGGAKNLQEGPKEGSWKGKDEEGLLWWSENQVSMSTFWEINVFCVSVSVCVILLDFILLVATYVLWEMYLCMYFSQ